MAKEKPINTNSSEKNIINSSQNLHHQVSQDHQDDLEGDLINRDPRKTSPYHYASTNKAAA